MKKRDLKDEFLREQASVALQQLSGTIQAEMKLSELAEQVPPLKDVFEEAIQKLGEDQANMAAVVQACEEVESAVRATPCIRGKPLGQTMHPR